METPGGQSDLLTSAALRSRVAEIERRSSRLQGGSVCLHPPSLSRERTAGRCILGVGGKKDNKEKSGVGVKYVLIMF